jgi:hypothetical protein
MRKPGRRSRGTRKAAVAIFAALAIVLGIAGAAAANSNPQLTAILNAPGICGASEALVYTPAPATTESFTLSYTDCSFHTFRTWQANWFQVQNLVWDYPYPSAHLCASDPWVHPSQTTLVSGINDNITIPSTCTHYQVNNCYLVANQTNSQIYYGFPASWYSGNSITPFVTWECVV